MVHLPAFSATTRRLLRAARSAGPGLKIASLLGILSLPVACSSDSDTPNGNGAVGGTSGGSITAVGGSTGGTLSQSGGKGGVPSLGGSGGSAGKATGGSTSPAGGKAGSGGGSGGSVTAGSGGASGGAAGSTSGGSAGAQAGGTAGAAGNAGAPTAGTSGGVGGAGGAGNAGNAGAPTAGAAGGGAYNPCPTDGTPCKIVPMGDSITVGIGMGATGGGYRVELAKMAAADGKKIVFDGVGEMTSGCPYQSDPPQNPPAGFVNKHSACSGWLINQIAGMTTTSLALKPDIILLMAGTNDVVRMPSGAAGRLGMLLDGIFAADSDVLVVVAQLTPLQNNNGPDAINEAIPDLVETRAAAGKHIMMVDMNSDYPPNSLPDTIHPNQAGYVFMAEVWYEAIKDLLP